MKALSNLSHFFATHPLTRNNPVGAWGRFAYWQIRSRLQDEVIFPWIEGQKLIVTKGMTGATGNIYAGLHEFYDMMLPLHFLRKGDLFLDVGANIGSYTVLAAGVCEATTWAFEPDPMTARHLQRNIAINGLDGLVTVHEVALGPSDGEVKFTIGQDTANRVTTGPDCLVRTVRQKRLDDLVTDQKPTMIKMDVEGYEEKILVGSQAVLSLPSLKLIELETVNPTIKKMLDHHGFTACSYDPFARKLQLTSLSHCSSNSAFVRDIDFVQRRLSDARTIVVLGRSI
jgi:FkbM family methyltransferase